MALTAQVFPVLLAPPRPKRRSRPTARPLPGKADEPILRVLARYHYLTAEQIRRLLYGRSLSYARERLAALANRKGACLRLEIPHAQPTGASPRVFRLATRGYTFLRELGIEPHRLPDERPHSYLYWRHTLALNDFLIAVQLLTREIPGLSVETLVHERDLKHAPIPVTLPTGEAQRVVPDAFLTLREEGATGAYRTDLVVELDMGTTDQREWRVKARRLVAALGGPFQDRFGVAGLIIAVLAPGNPVRRDELLRWTRAELTAVGREDAGAYFRFGAVAAAAAPPATALLAPTWFSPFVREPASLLQIGDEGP